MNFVDNILDTEDSSFAIDEFLAVEAEKDLLRFSTAGSVDDGKSTLIGRLLYDSRNVYEDQVRAVTGRQVGQQQPAIDFALLTDGLRAEREQGITIDVAYRYFSTQRRKFIIADTPGHEQYTRNMATGASTADLAIILIDARKGILTQTRRHISIATVMGTRHLVAAINKMDLLDFSEDIYRDLSAQLKALVEQVGGRDLVTIPVSALDGDNVVDRSTRTPWYTGPTLLEHLESVPLGSDAAALPFRMPVQRVIRPHHNFRGFAGQVVSGTIRRGERITAYPSAISSRVASIVTYDGDLEEASAPLSITVTLEDELDISRGDLLASAEQAPRQAVRIEASLVWFDSARLDTYRPYLLKHGASMQSVRVNRVLSRTDVSTLAEEAVSSLGMNEIGIAEIELTRPLYFDPYAMDRATGSFILIDPQSNSTVAAGLIRRGLSTSTVAAPAEGAVLLLRAASAQADVLEAGLSTAGAQVVRTRIVDSLILRGLLGLGLVVLVETDQWRAGIAVDVEVIEVAGDADLNDVLHLLASRGILRRAQAGDHHGH